MKTVEVKLKKLEISEYDPIQNLVTYTLFLNDGADKAIRRTISATDVEDIGKKLVAEVKSKIKALHSQNAGSDDVLGGFVNVLLQDDEDMEDKISRFFMSVSGKANLVRKSKITRIDMKKQIEGTKLEWN